MTFMTNYIDDIRILEKEIQKKDKEIQQIRAETKQIRAETKQVLIKQLKMLDDSVVAEINGKTIEEVEMLRRKLLG